MPAETTARKRKEPNQGRPFGSVTRFPGSVVFSRTNGTTQSHLYRVLIGERKSARIVNAYADFLRAQNIPWPAAAKVKPTKKAA